MECADLIAGMYSYLLDNDYRPYIIVNTKVDDVYGIPEGKVMENDRIVLDIHPAALASGFAEITEKWVQFSCRFDGQHHDISMPPEAIEAIYGHGTQAQLVFGKRGEPQDEKPSVSSNRPKLRVVH